MSVDAVGGVWTYALDLARGLASHGVVTEMAVLGPPPTEQQRRLACATPGVAALRETGLPLDWLAAGSDEVERAAAGVAELAARCRVDLIHLNTPALAAFSEFAHPLVAVAHSCLRTWWEAVEGTASPLPQAWQSELVACGYRATAPVTPSLAFAEMTQRAYDLPQRPYVVRNGRYGTPGRHMAAVDFVLTAGRLWDRGKNVAALDRVAADLPWRVCAAGPVEGPDGSRIALRHIVPLGVLDAEALAEVVAQRPIFVSLARYEPFGLAVLEAAQAGSALVLADTAVFRELWDGVAHFVPLDDDAAAKDALRRLMADPMARRAAGARAAAHAARYTVEAMAAGMLRHYGAAVAGVDVAA